MKSAIPVVGRIGLAITAVLLVAASPVPSAQPSGSPAPDASASPTATAVTIDKSGFHPPSIHVLVGQTVAWTNADKTEHTATAADGSWDTGPIQPGQTVDRTFYDAGKWDYVCGFTPQLRAAITVATPAPIPSPRPVSIAPASIVPAKIAPAKPVSAPATSVPTPDTGGGG